MKLTRSATIVTSAVVSGVVAVALAASAYAPRSSAERPEVQHASWQLLPRNLLGPEPLIPSLRLDRRAFAAARALAADADYGAAIDQCVVADMAARQTPGASVAVALDGVMIHEKGYGVKHRTTGGAVGTATQFRIGSITKMMTAAAVMQQVEAGLVDLDAPVTDYVGEFSVAPPYDASDMTVRNLLTHTTGFPDLLLEVAGPIGPSALDTWAAEQGDVPPYAPPGEFWNYSNPNFNLAGLVAQRASGLEYHQLMAARVWGPAGMSATTLFPAEVMARGDWSYGHFSTGPGGAEAIYDPDDYDNWVAAPAGFAFSTAGDLVRWVDLLMTGGGAALAPSSAAEMQRPQVSLDYRPDMFYGLGIFTEDYRGLDLRQHGGNVPGWGSMLIWVPERRFAVAVLANTFESLGQAAYCIVDAVLQPTGEIPDDTTARPLWRRFAGDYEVLDVTENRFQAEVRWSEGSFRIVFTDRDRPRYYYTTSLVQVFHDTFLIDGDGNGTLDTDVTFVRSADVATSTRWLRYRHLVGELRTPLRQRGSGTAP